MPLPPGYTLDAPEPKQGGGGLPPGYTLDAPDHPKQDSGFHPLDSLGHAIGSWWDQVNPAKQVEGTAEAIRHPVQAAHGMAQQNVDLFNKAKGSFDKGDYAGAVRHGVNYFLNGIPGLGASVDEAGNKFEKGDYAGGTGDALGIGTNLVVGAKAPELMSDAMNLPGKVAAKVAKPERLYQSALKPSTRLPSAQRQAIVQTGLKEGVPVSASGIEEIQGRTADLNHRIKDTISDAAAKGDTIDPQAVAQRVDQVRPTFAKQVNPDADLAALEKTKREFLNGPGAGPIPVDMAQDVKQGTYKQIRKNYGKLSNADVEGQKALARGIKEELQTKYPELQSLNARDGSLMQLEDAISKAVARIDNHQMFGIGTPLAAAGAEAVTGSPGIAMAAGAARALIDQPIIKSRLAIALHKAKARPSALTPGITRGQAVRGAVLNARPDPLGLTPHLEDSQ